MGNVINEQLRSTLLGCYGSAAAQCSMELGAKGMGQSQHCVTSALVRSSRGDKASLSPERAHLQVGISEAPYQLLGSLVLDL